MKFSSVAPHSFLKLNGLRYPVHIGCTQEEREKPQAVTFDLTLRFSRLPKGCQTDQLEDTLCYGELSEIIKNLCQSQQFNLIEHLGFLAYSVLKKKLPPEIQVVVKVTKEKPPIPELMGGASFACGDALEI